MDVTTSKIVLKAPDQPSNLVSPQLSVNNVMLTVTTFGAYPLLEYLCEDKLPTIYYVLMKIKCQNQMYYQRRKMFEVQRKLW